MGWIRQAKCDGPGCGAVRKEANHWIEATLSHQRPGCLDITIFPMDPAKPSFDRECFCGIPCLVKRISEESERLPDRNGAKE